MIDQVVAIAREATPATGATDPVRRDTTEWGAAKPVLPIQTVTEGITLPNSDKVGYICDFLIASF